MAACAGAAGPAPRAPSGLATPSLPAASVPFATPLPGASGATPSSAAPAVSARSPAATSGAHGSAAPPSATGAPGPTSSTPAAGGSLPAFGHVYLIVLENRDYGQIVGNASAPYLNELIARYGLATNYHAVAHPSEPNYIALFSGSTQGVTDDGVHDIGAANLATQLEAHGRTWRVYAQNVPGGCYTGYSASGGVDGPGTYARKHEPAISFTDISGSPGRCANIQDLHAFDPAAADFELIIPNMCNDMHDCSTATGDTWLRSFVPRILDSAAWRTGGALFITFDEGFGQGNQVATLVISPSVGSGLRSDIPFDHYSLLRTIQDAWGLGCLANSCRANDMRAFWAGG